MAHHPSNRMKEIRRRRVKRRKVLRLRKNFAMAKTDEQRSQVARKIEALGSQVPAVVR